MGGEGPDGLPAALVSTGRTGLLYTWYTLLTRPLLACVMYDVYIHRVRAGSKTVFTGVYAAQGLEFYGCE
jgi:hypothetical protein